MSKILVIAKPDLVIRRGPGAKMLREFFAFMKSRVVASNKVKIGEELAKEHYVHLKDKPFFRWIIRYITSYDAFVFVVESEVQVEKTREILGNTFVEKANENSLRGKYGLTAGMNGLHVSESQEMADREIRLWEEHGVLHEGVLNFNAEEYITKYADGMDNTQEIHRILRDVKGKESVDSTATMALHDKIKEEANDISRDVLERFYGIFLETLKER